MASQALNQRLFEETVTAFDGGTIASPADGVELIDGWLKVIEGNASAEIVEGKLIELRDQLQDNNPDADRIRELLFSLADHTSQVAQGSNRNDQTAGNLENVATSLRKLAGQL